MKWGDGEIALLRRRYADEPTPALAAALGRKAEAIEKYARRLGLRKSEARIRAARIFPPGAGAGSRFCGSEGEPEGAERIAANGQLYRKVNADGASHAERWRPVHELVWVAENGPIPEGCIIVFKPGFRTTDPARITPERVECVTRAELMRRNSRSRLPLDLVRAIAARAALMRRINQRQEQLK